MFFARFLVPLVLLACVAMGGEAVALEQGGALPVSRDYVTHNWEIDDGLPSNRVLGIAQTPDGYLWLATAEGLARFDGVRFTTFPAGTTPGLPVWRVNALFVDHAGVLWVGMHGGAISRRVGNKFEVVAPAAASESAGWVTSFAEDAGGAVWFGYESPVLVRRWKDGRVTDFSGRDGLASGGGGSAHENQVCATKTGMIWYANTVACGPFDGKRFYTVDPDAGGYTHLARSADGGMWARRGDWLVRYGSDGRVETRTNIAAYSVHVMLEDSAGNLWLGTNNAGLIRLRDGRMESVPVDGGAVASLFEDREGNLWVGTQSGGVTRVCARNFTMRQMADGLRDDEVYSLCLDNENRLWLAGHNAMLARGTDATNATFSAPSGSPNLSSAMTVCRDPDGGVWIGTLGGVFHWRDGKFSHESIYQPVTALLEDQKKNLWVAMIDGPLVRHRDGHDTRIPANGGLEHVLALAEDAAGRIWAGTFEGRVFAGDSSGFTRVDLPGTGRDDGVRFIVADKKGDVWIGAAHSGLYRWRDGKIARLPADTGLPTGDLRSLLISPDGDFWVGTSQGLFRVSGAELADAMDGRSEKLHCVTYGRSDGLPPTEFSLGFRGATARDAEGNLWFATARGALEVKRPEPVPARAAPPVVIEEMQADDRAVDIAENSMPRVPALSGTLRIRYTQSQLRYPDRVRFRYRLAGSGDDRWVDAGAQRSVTFMRLPPGRYRLDVSATAAGEPWPAGPGASLRFSVLPAWWETSLFRVGVAGAGMLALVCLVRMMVLARVRARLRKLEQEHALERERTRISRDIHDRLGAELTQIAITGKLLTLDPPGAVAAHGREISGLAKRAAESLDEIVWAVNPHYDSLPALAEYLGMFAAEFLSAAKIASEVDVPGGLPALAVSSNARHHLFLAVKEALNNVVKHSGAKASSLRVEWRAPVLRVTVTDDGRGFDAGAPAAVGSDGLRNLRERMEEIGGAFQIESTPGKGTRAVFLLPLAEAHA